MDIIEEKVFNKNTDMSLGSNYYENSYLDYKINSQWKDREKQNKKVILKINKETLYIEVIGIKK